MAGYYRNLPCCALYDTLGEEAINYICSQTKMNIVIVENVQKLKILFNTECKYLKTVVLVHSNGKIPEKDGVKVVSWKDTLLTEGKLIEKRPQPDDLATINYTSGTTGKPKGVMLSHRAMMTSAIGVGEFMMCGQKPTTEDVWFSYLPMAHIFERIAHVMLLSYGAKWAYTSGDMTKIIHELSLVKPTIFGAVPRTLNKLVDKIKARIDAPGLKTAIKGKMLKLAMKKKRELLDQGIVTKDTNWDKQVLRQVQEWIY